MCGSINITKEYNIDSKKNISIRNTYIHTVAFPKGFEE